mmetsp:Transcript_12989/g.15401  ORF Transcript_12989/g.15401 Transcript_12989/m.15401 type:complete len:304 (+) Transcript_12989:108-1019(+)
MMGDEIEPEDDHDSDIDVAIQEALEEDERKAQEAKKDEGVLGMGDMEMRMAGGGKGGRGGPPAGMMPKIRRGTKACNTGPKGVKADYEEAKLIMQFKNLRKAMRAERELKKRAKGKEDFSHVANQNLPQKSTNRDDEDEDEDEDEEDDEIFRKYKQQRIDLIKNSLPTYGRFYRVKRDEFISETEKEHELIHVVVHLYQNTIPACIRLNLILEDIAPQFTHVKFIRTRSTDLVESFSNVALPMLLVYRGGEVVHTIPQVSKHFPRKWEDKDVVAYLAKKGILNKQAYKPPRQSKKDIRLKEDY